MPVNDLVAALAVQKLDAEDGDAVVAALAGERHEVDEAEQEAPGSSRDEPGAVQGAGDEPAAEDAETKEPPTGETGGGSGPG